MQKAILIHGMPGKEEYFDPSCVAPSQNHWFPWLHRQLQLKDIFVQSPEMPTPYDARYEEWAKVLIGFAPDKDTMLVGHSLGAGFLVRWLSEYEGKVGRVVLVAPWLDPKKELRTGFFDFMIDERLKEKTKDITVFISDNDDEEMHWSVDPLKKKIKGLEVREFQGKGHFIEVDMGTNEFPELLEHLLA